MLLDVDGDVRIAWLSGELMDEFFASRILEFEKVKVLNIRYRDRIRWWFFISDIGGDI